MKVLRNPKYIFQKKIITQDMSVHKTVETPKHRQSINQRTRSFQLIAQNMPLNRQLRKPLLTSSSFHNWEPPPSLHQLKPLGTEAATGD